MDGELTACPACGAATLEIDVRCGQCGVALTSTGIQRRVGSVVLEHYEVLDVLGQGGMSVVYRGKHKLTEQEVALKILPPELAAHAQVKSRFVDEARALAQLDHPNIVHLYNFGQDDDCFVLAMQYVKGETWERKILEKGRLDWRATALIAIDVLCALEYAHSRGIVHRDMKPSNVLCRIDGSSTVMDFGIAKMTTSSRLTATGQTMGTVRYMSPEQVRGGELDHRTDLYSLAVTIYESLTGSTPFEGDSHFEIMTAHLSTPPPPMGSQAEGVPPALERLVMSALAKLPADRPATAAAFREALEAILAGLTPELPVARVEEPAASEVTQQLHPRRHRHWLALAGLVVAGAAATTAWLVSQGDRDRDTTGGAAASGAGRAEPVAEPWPAPFLLPGLVLAVDQRFEPELLRVQSVARRPSEDIRAGFAAAQERFFALLGERGTTGIERQPLNVVIVPRAVLCDRRIYESGIAPPGCEDQGWFLRPRDKTVYLADLPDRLVINLADAAATNVCLQAQSAACEATLDVYLDELVGEAGKAKTSPK